MRNSVNFSALQERLSAVTHCATFTATDGVVRLSQATSILFDNLTKEQLRDLYYAYRDFAVLVGKEVTKSMEREKTEKRPVSRLTKLLAENIEVLNNKTERFRVMADRQRFEAKLDTMITTGNDLYWEMLVARCGTDPRACSEPTMTIDRISVPTLDRFSSLEGEGEQVIQPSEEPQAFPEGHSNAQ